MKTIPASLNATIKKQSPLKQLLWCFALKEMVLRLRYGPAKGVLLKFSLMCI